MTGTTLTPQAVNSLFGANVAGASQPQLSPSIVNSYRVAAVAGRLLAHVKSGYPGEAMEFFNLCLSLSRGIDYAVANNEVPAITQDLPVLLKQICQRKSDKVLEAAIMVLMISVKNACKVGWFSEKETEELFSLANEIGSGFCSIADVKTGPSCSLAILDKIMERYYPLMKMGEILASMEVKPGYGAHVLDFHIPKTTVYSPQEKIRLFVAQTDNIETSACITSPQQVNFLLNGKGVDRRINVSMDTGPQMPSIVTGMLKFGSNLLQAVGQFNGHYIIVVAFMSATSSLGTPVLKDYAQPIVPSSNADSDIVEGPSRISLNCPISYTRIKTPAKGHLCKHLQCFDVSNYVGINVRRPSWRCPHCNQSVCYLDIRVDQNMVKVLGEVGKNVTEVIISMDGSWKAVLEGDDDLDRANDKGVLKETNELEESHQASTALPIVLDLTENDSEMDLGNASETEDVKPLRNTNGANQSVASQVDDDFWSGIQFPDGSSTSGSRSNMQIDGGTSRSGPANYYQSPVLTDAISPAFDRGTESHVNTNHVASAMQSQYSSPSYLQLQQVQLPSSTASNEYGRFHTHLALPRTPTAVQALPVQSPETGLQQRLRTPIPSSASLSSQSIPPAASGVNAICSDLERQQHFSRIQMNSPLVTNIASSQQNLSQRAQFQNAHLQQTFNPRTPQTMGQSSSALRSSSHLSRAHIQPGNSQVGTGQTSGSLNNQQRLTVNAQRAAVVAGQSPSTPVQNQTHRINHPVPPSAGEQSRNVGGTAQAVVGTAGAADSSAEQDWRPTRRMRGSLQGHAYSAALNQFIIAPTQPSQGVRPPNLTSPLPTVPSHIQALMGSRSTQVPQTPTSHPQ